MISVVIPTFNEAEQLPGCLAALRDQTAHELIVADGSSTDGTVEMALAAGAVIVHCGVRQRAAQMNAGARRAAGEVLLFLHADTHLPAGALAAAESAVAGGAIGGCFRLRLRGASPALAAFVPLGDLHCRATRTTFGDRAFFARRDAFETAGGFPLQEIMEDVELGRQLKRLGQLAVLPLSVTCSARHFRRQGGVRVAVKAALCCGLYDVGVAPRRLARFYWGEAYARGLGAGGSEAGGSRPRGAGAGDPRSETGGRGAGGAGQDSVREGSSS
jgi:rSAM/selenodomain-associated transferase 2